MRNINCGKKPELLAPAGSPEALRAAIEAGADAVYFGAGDFNARMRAKNFSDGELTEALKLCAGYGVKSYVTVNTRLRDSELDGALSLAEKLYLDGVSALIVADPGAAHLMKKRIPDIELHASTQLSGHSSVDAEVFSSMGFSRMVCPREMSVEEIRELCEKSLIEIEMFIHGAHCVSFSGQCLMSYAMGGRSGNRGMCAQPCRLPFTVRGVGDRHPVSLKDMCLADSISQIITSGVASLKIEGRQKSADYVYGTVKAYRKLLDEAKDASPSEVRELAALFSRGGFSDGYLKRNYKGMLGVRSEDGEDAGGAKPSFRGLERKLTLDASLTVKTGERAELSVTDGLRRAVVCGEEEVKPRTEGNVMSAEEARSSMSRLGATPFVLGKFDFEIDGDAYFTLSSVNRLRREAVSKLTFPEERKICGGKCEEGEPADGMRSSTAIRKRDGKQLLTAEFRSYSQIPKSALSFFDRIYIPMSDSQYADGEKICLNADPLTFDGGVSEFYDTLKGVRGEILVHGFGQAKIASDRGLDPVASLRFNVFNSECAKEVSRYARAVFISPEVPLGLLGSLDRLGISSAVTVYGKLPLMHTQRCILSDGGSVCPFGGRGGRSYPYCEKRTGAFQGKKCDGTLCTGEMTDRTGAVFPIIGLRDCSNIVFNSVPIYMADKMNALAGTGADRLHFIFTDESSADCAGIIEAYKNKKAPHDPSGIRRLK